MSELTLLIDEAARLLRVSRRTVYYRIRDGRLRTIRAKCGSQRVLLSSIQELLRTGVQRKRRARDRTVPAESDALESESLTL